MTPFIDLRAAVAVALGIFALLVGAMPTATRATPPDMVTIDDTLLGVSDTHVFILRSTGDNLGLHQAWRTETWLVVLDPSTGAEELLPVHAITRRSEWLGENRGDDITLDGGLPEGAVNPFAAMAERGGVPTLARGNDADARSREILPVDGLLLDAPGGPYSYALPLAKALGRARASVTALAERVEDVDRMSTLSTRQYYRDKTFSADVCEFTTFGWTVRVDRGTRHFQPMRMSCTDPDSMTTTSLIQFLPARDEAEAM